MIVIYNPDEGEPGKWPFRPEKLLTSEGEAIEKVTGMTFVQFGEAMANGSPTAMRALVWVLRKRHGEPDLRFRDVDFPLGALSIELDPEEQEQAEREQAEQDDETSVPKEETETSDDASGT